MPFQITLLDAEKVQIVCLLLISVHYAKQTSFFPCCLQLFHSLVFVSKDFFFQKEYILVKKINAEGEIRCEVSYDQSMFRGIKRKSPDELA